MNADSTLFTNNDLTEPGFGGQVVAWSFKEGTLNSTRRIFKRISPNDYYVGIWADESKEQFYFSDLRDIVIVNRGLEK